MTQSKLGTGTNYAGLSGFTWPSGQNPQLFNVIDTKKHEHYKLPFSDYNIIQDSGSENSQIGLTGELFTEANFNSLRAQIKKTSLDSDGEIQDYNQKLYLNSNSKFRWVRGLSFTDKRAGDRPVSYPYTCTLISVFPFIYHDALAGGSNTTTNTTVTVSGSGLDNDGTAYVFPWFEITNNDGASITAISITDGTNTMTWSGTLEVNKSIRIVQEYNAEYGLDAWTVYKYDNENFTGTPSVVSGLSGDKIYFDADSESNSIDMTLTGNNDTATAAVRFRERDY